MEVRRRVVVMPAFRFPVCEMRLLNVTCQSTHRWPMVGPWIPKPCFGTAVLTAPPGMRAVRLY